VLAHAAGIPVEEALLAGVTVIAGYVRAIAARWRGAREHRRIQANAGLVSLLGVIKECDATAQARTLFAGGAAHTVWAWPSFRSPRRR
jgi:hypothetical protein